MTRDDIKKMFPDATDEQITNMLNQVNAEKKAAAEKGISDEELTALRNKAKAYDDVEKEKMTEKERYEALIQEAETAKAEAARIRARTKAEAEFIKAGMTEAEYKDLLDDVLAEDDDKTIAKVGRIVGLIKSKTDAAVKTTTENLTKESMKPQSNGNGKEEKVDASVTLAKELATNGNNTDSKSPFEYYK